MEKKKNYFVMFSVCISLVLAFSIISFGTRMSYAFTLGKTYDSNNWQEIDEIAPPFLVNWVKRGDFVLKTGGLNLDLELEKDFLLASQKNLGKFDFNEKGFIVEKETQKTPKFIYGLPFPSIAPQDKKAGEKIMANNLYGAMRVGSDIMPNNYIFLGRAGMEREIKFGYKRLNYQGRQGGPIRNPHNFLFQYICNVISPMDMKDTVALFWEYNDDRKATYISYVSALRKIRRVSPSCRSDPFIGGDMCMDDDKLWRGKNDRHNWKLIGEKEVLCGFSTPDKMIVQDLPDGTVRWVSPQLKLGYEIPNWQGASWAPVNATWTPRPVWIVEAVPKDPEYNYGRQLFYVDKDTFMIWFKEVYDWSGQYWIGLLAVQSFQVAPSGRNNVFRPDLYMGIDEKKQHSSCVVQIDSIAGANNVFYCPESIVGPKDFSMDAAQQLSK